MSNLAKTTAAVALASVVSVSAQAGDDFGGDITANATFSNNYLWRGLTQSLNEPAISGGIDYAHDSGIYIGTWLSNVQYGPADTFSYEHDLYIGYANEFGPVSYDFGFLYYNYDEEANIDFGEVYGSLGWSYFSVTGYVLTHTEANESGFPDEDGNAGQANFGFGDAFYVSGDFAYPIYKDVELGLHVGYHDGDFVNGFNFNNGVDNEFSYVDYSASVSKGGFTFMVSDTDLDDTVNAGAGQQNESVKWVLSYTIDIDI